MHQEDTQAPGNVSRVENASQDEEEREPLGAGVWESQAMGDHRRALLEQQTKAKWYKAKPAVSARLACR